MFTFWKNYNWSPEMEGAEDNTKADTRFVCRILLVTRLILCVESDDGLR